MPAVSDTLKSVPTLLTIAGFDPSSGAGVSADLATFAAHGCFGTACITALTVQSTTGVQETHPVAGSVVLSTLRCLDDDLPAEGIKIGMLADASVLETIAGFLEQTRVRHPQRPVVLDPVLRSSSGRDLLERSALDLLHTQLLPLVSWITPNLSELGVLTNREALGRADLLGAARELQQAHPQLGLVVTGGHMDPPDDLIVPCDGEAAWIGGKSRLRSRSTHGTGCAYSSALLCGLVLGRTPVEAARGAKEYVYRAIESAPGLGAGQGPLNHLWSRPIGKMSGHP